VLILDLSFSLLYTVGRFMGSLPRFTNSVDLCCDVLILDLSFSLLYTVGRFMGSLPGFTNATDSITSDLKKNSTVHREATLFIKKSVLFIKKR
jgi:hypothetical protein